MAAIPTDTAARFVEFLENSYLLHDRVYKTSWEAIKAFKLRYPWSERDVTIPRYQQLVSVFAEFTARHWAKHPIMEKQRPEPKYEKYEWSSASRGFTVTDKALAHDTDVIFEGNNYRPITKRMTGAQIALAFGEQFQTRKPTMTTRIAVCVFTSSSAQYEYLYDTDDITLINGDFAVISRKDGPLEISNMSIVHVIETRDFVDANWEGSFRWLVGRIEAGKYEERQKNEKRRKQLIKQLSDMADKRSSLDKLSKLLADDPTAKPLLEELKKLTK